MDNSINLIRERNAYGRSEHNGRPNIGCNKVETKKKEEDLKQIERSLLIMMITISFVIIIVILLWIDWTKI